MSMPRKAMQELGFQACCLRCDAGDTPGLARCAACIQHHRTVREVLASAPPDDPLFQLAKEIMAMAASPQRYSHDETHGESLVEQQRLAGALVPGRPKPTEEDVFSSFEAQRTATKANVLRDVGNQNPWSRSGIEANDAREIGEATLLVDGSVEASYGARTVPSKPIQSVDRSDRLGEDTALTDRVHAAATTVAEDETVAEIFEDLAFKERQQERKKLKSAMDDIKKLVEDDLEF